MTVPRLLVLTDRHRCEAAGRDLPGTVEQVVAAGAPAVVLREKDLDPLRRARLGEQVADIVHRAGASLIVASDAALRRRLDAQGLHLAAADPLPAGVGGRASAVPASRPAADGSTLTATPTGPQPQLLGRSCHDHAEVAAATSQPLDYLTVSPVRPTTSKPGYGPPLGIDGVRRLVARTSLPVLALGGIGVAEVADLVATGVHGVAVMGAVMGAREPGAVTNDLLRALGGPR